MHLIKENIYHVFNRGNNKGLIFFNSNNYLYFLKGVNRYLVPNCDILAWCLMPTHFHFLIHATSNSMVEIVDGSFSRQQFSQSIKQLLSSYTKAINKQQNRVGSLFQQKTKAICVSDNKYNDPGIVFHYIHQNPLKAKLVQKMEDWEFSSFRDYVGLRDGKLCNKKIAKELMRLDMDRLYTESYQVINYDIT